MRCQYRFALKGNIKKHAFLKFCYSGYKIADLELLFFTTWVHKAQYSFTKPPTISCCACSVRRKIRLLSVSSTDGLVPSGTAAGAETVLDFCLIQMSWKLLLTIISYNRWFFYQHIYSSYQSYYTVSLLPPFYRWDT